MPRLIKTFFVPYVGSWLFLVAAQQLAAQQSVEIPADTIEIADLGLEDQMPTAADLVGPEDGSAGRNRVALAHRLQCWIDAVESFAFADLNDPRVREIRRFLATGPVDRDGAVVIHFPDQTRVHVRLARESAPDLNNWDQRVYEAVVLQDTVQGLGLVQGQSPDSR